MWLETEDMMQPSWIPYLVFATDVANSANVEMMMEKEKTVSNAEPPPPVQLSEAGKLKHEKSKFTALSFLHREKSTDRAGSSSGSSASLTGKAGVRKSFFSKNSKNSLQS
jgi:hypothetical protein